MYIKEQLQSECATRVVFESGIAYYTGGNVEKVRFAEKKNTEGSIVVEVLGTVRAEHETYSVRAFVDEVDDKEKSGKLLLKYCSCADNSKNGNMCKHCVAVLLKYFDKRAATAEKGDENDFKRTVDEIESVTDSDLIALMRDSHKQKNIEIRLKNRENTMRLVPFLNVGESSINLELKTGADKLYIVKNIPFFIKSIETNQNILLGKSNFVMGSKSLYDVPSKRLIEFLSRYFETLRANEIPEISKNNVLGRKITLKNREIDGFFEAMSGNEIFVYDSTADAQSSDYVEVTEDGLENNYWLCEVKKEIPELKFSITGLDGEGAIVTGNFPKIFSGLDDFVFKIKNTFYVVPKKDLSDAEKLLDYLAQMTQKCIFVSEEDLPLFVSEILPVMKKYFKVSVIDFEEKIYLPEKATIKLYLDAPKKAVITCKPIASYGPNEEDCFNIFADRDYQGKILRDETLELSVYQTLKKYFTKFSSKNKTIVLDGGDEPFYEFITKGIQELYEIGEVFVTDKIRAVKVKNASSVSAGVSIDGNILELSIKSDDFTSEQLAEILATYSKKKKFFRLRDGTFISISGEEFGNLADIAKTLNLGADSFENGVAKIPKYRALYLENEFSGMNGLKVTRSEDFKKLVSNMKEFEKSDFKVPKSLSKCMKKYQKDGYAWLKTLKNNGFGGILADEMGLGKTVQTIAFLLSEYEAGETKGTLIVCPASLVYNWKSEIERFAPSLNTVVVAGKQEERVKIFENSNENDILITSYDLLKRDIDYYIAREFAFQIIDEAQYIKNYGTQSSRSVKKIRAGFKVALTGTPIENRLSELWSVFDYLMPGFLNLYKQFRENYEYPIVHDKDNETMLRLRKMIRPFILRRLKSEVLKDLPEKIDESVMTELTTEQRKLYLANLEEVRNVAEKSTTEQIKVGGVQILAELMRLRQICCDPALIYENYTGGSAKVELCMDLIKRAIDGGHKILVFSQFTTMLEILEKRLESEKVDYYSLVGQTPKEKRTRMVSDFNEGDVSVFCISLKAGGTGLNLTSADIVILFDPWWNVAVENQAADRVHRIGQDKVVTVYKLIAKGTIEENILKLQEKKQKLAGSLLVSGDFEPSSLSREDLLALLK